MMRHKIVLLAVAAAGSACAVAIAAPFSGSERPGHTIDPAPTPFDRAAAQSARAAHVPAQDPRPEFAVLRRARVAKDALPAKWRPRSAVGTPRVSDARLAVASSLGEVYAVPTDREVCAVSTYAKANDGGASEACAPTADAAASGALTVLQCIDGVHPSPQFVSGLIGDDVSAVRALAAGVEVGRAKVAANAFQLVIDRPADSLEYVGSGTKVPLPSASC